MIPFLVVIFSKIAGATLILT